MLYILHGDDFIKRTKKLEDLVGFFMTKKPGTPLLKINAENFSQYNLEEIAVGRGLFEQKCVVVLDGLLEVKEIKELFLDQLKTLAESENFFVVNERTPGKVDLSVLIKKAEKVQGFSLKGNTTRPSFNIFSLSDAIGGREKKRAWALFLRAVESGSEPEEIHGTIFWQIKSMLLIKEARQPTPESTGLKLFVLSKAKSFADNYSRGELHKISSRLVALYHDSHRGIGDLSVGLEKLILEAL